MHKSIRRIHNTAQGEASQSFFNVYYYGDKTNQGKMGGACLEHFIYIVKPFWIFEVFLTMHHSTELFHQPTLMHNFCQSALNQRTGQTFTDSEDTRCCVNTFFLLKMGMLMLETCRG